MSEGDLEKLQIILAVFIVILSAMLWLVFDRALSAICLSVVALSNCIVVHSNRTKKNRHG